MPSQFNEATGAIETLRERYLREVAIEHFSAIQLVESATVIAGQLRAPMCYIIDKPRALVEYALGSIARQEQEARVDASIHEFYQECRANGSPSYVGD